MGKILFGIGLFVLIFNVLVSTMRGARKSLLRLLTVLFSLAVAFFLSRVLSVEMAAWLLPKMRGVLDQNEMLAPFVNGEIAAGDAIALLAEMLVAPLLFLFLYIAVKALSLVLFAILKLLTGFLKPLDKTAVSRLLGAAVGVLIALVGIAVFVTPVLGYIELTSVTVDVLARGSETAGVVESTATGAESEKRLLDAEVLNGLNEDYLKPVLDMPVLSAIYRSFGSKIFDSLTSETWDGETVHLKSELVTLADIVANIGILGDSGVTAFDEGDSLAAEHIAQDVGASPLLSDLFAGTLSVASKHWLAGETFLGIEKPDMGVNGKPLFNSFLVVFSTADRQTVGEDLDFFSDTFGLFVEHELFVAFLTEQSNDDAIAILLSDSGLFADIQLLIAEHPRMQPVGQALVDFGMRVMLQEMGLPEDIPENCSSLLSDMTDALQGASVNEDGSIDRETFTTELSQIFADNGLNVSDEAAHLIAEGIADHFTAEELDMLTADAVMEKLVCRFESVDISGLLADLPVLP